MEIITYMLKHKIDYSTRANCVFAQKISMIPQNTVYGIDTFITKRLQPIASVALPDFD